MGLNEFIEKVKKSEVILLGELSVTETEYEFLVNYTANKIKSLYIQTNETFDILISITLVQIAIREYKEGNYWDCFSEIFDNVPSNKRNYIGKIFYQTLKVYKLFTIENEPSSRMQYVENIKAHAFVPNHYLLDYFDFLFSFYDKNLARTIPEDLSEDIEEFQEYLVSTLNNSDDNLKVDAFGTNSTKSYKLLKATRIVLSKLDATYVARLLKSHLAFIDNYYFDNQLPKKCGRFEMGIYEWSSSVTNQFADRGKRKRKSGKWYVNRKPYYRLLDSSFELIVPEQKFRLDEFSGYVNIKINGIDLRKLEAYRAFGIIITEEIIVVAENIFSETQISISSLITKDYFIPHKKYRIFDEDKNEIEKLKSGYCYLAINHELEVVFQDCEKEYVKNINNTSDIYFLKVNETSVVYIDHIPLSLAGEFSAKTQYEYVSNEYLIVDENENKIQSAYRHPVISFIIGKEHLEKSLIWCNQERFSINNSYTSVFFEMPYDTSKIGVSIDLNNILVAKDGYYQIFLDEPSRNMRIIEEYLLITNLRCSPDKRRYVFCKEALITIYGNYPVEPLNTNVNESGKYILSLNEAVKNANFNLFVDNRVYKLIVPVNVLQFGFNNLLSCDRQDYVWHKKISNNFNLILPGASKAWVYLNKDEELLIEGDLINRVFSFDISSFVNEINSINKPWHYLNIKYIDNKERRLSLLRVLKTLWFITFDLLQEGGNVFIFAKYQGDANCFVKIIDYQTNDVLIQRRNLVNNEKTYFPELNVDGLYRIERYSAQEDDFGFSEDICHLNTIFKIGVIDFSDISNCKVVIEQLLYKDQSLELNYNYIIRDLAKLEGNIYVGKIIRKQKHANTSVREETIFQRVKIEIVEFIEDKIHFSLLLEDNLDWLEPFYNCQSKCLSLEDSNKKATYKYLFEEETEFIAILRRDR